MSLSTRLAPLAFRTSCSLYGDPLFLQGRHLGQGGEIAIVVEDGNPMPNRTGGDQTVGTRTDRNTGSPRYPVELHSFFKDHPRHGRLKDRKGEHGLAGDAKCMLLQKSLEDFLNDGQACDHLVQIGHRAKLKAARPPEDLYPDGGIDQEHGIYRPGRVVAGTSPLISERSPSHNPDPASSRMRPALWRRR